MNDLITDWEKLIPVLMIGVGFILLLAGLIARSRFKYSDDELEEEKERRPQMAPLPPLLSTDRSDKPRP
ncbi:hypothetical protein J2R76_000189 [Bradyrhizobium sp. USDA 4532]|uniref:hypothetical protein n=1 Tax=unclassified Bradyrhizobium TaxID=2631580 RepID=UPI0020A07ABF|nr:MULTISPECIES: hypothetical protein [unclassified Bradyrhizobium]MCP1831762.1 hypothetical protein [Bradyrhizobium sp. USDA 4545]MCP1916598.1 hypothetical protein [Bradyrhizobium sp. USDA 4532]